MANADPPTAVITEPSPEDQRHELQGILGEYHGLLTTIVDRLSELAQGVELAQDAEMVALIGDIGNAFPGVSVSFGQVQGELNTDRHNEGLEGVALTAEQFNPKKRGFRYNCRRFYRAIADLPATVTSPQRRSDLIRAAKHAMRGVKWGNIIIGSLSKELGKFKGAEIIIEFGEVVVTILEQIVESGESEDDDEPR
jgi:hypothetical protein